MKIELRPEIKVEPQFPIWDKVNHHLELARAHEHKRRELLLQAFAEACPEGFEVVQVIDHTHDPFGTWNPGFRNLETGEVHCAGRTYQEAR